MVSSFPSLGDPTPLCPEACVLCDCVLDPVNLANTVIHHRWDALTVLSWSLACVTFFAKFMATLSYQRIPSMPLQLIPIPHSDIQNGWGHSLTLGFLMFLSASEIEQSRLCTPCPYLG